MCETQSRDERVNEVIATHLKVIGREDRAKILAEHADITIGLKT